MQGVSVKMKNPIVFLTYLKIEQTKQTGLTIEEYIQQEEHWIA